MATFIAQFPGAVLCVTHDRDLLDGVEWHRILYVGPNAAQIVELDREALARLQVEAQEEADKAVGILFD